MVALGALLRTGRGSAIGSALGWTGRDADRDRLCIGAGDSTRFNTDDHRPRSSRLALGTAGGDAEDHGLSGLMVCDGDSKHDRLRRAGSHTNDDGEGAPRGREDVECIGSIEDTGFAARAIEDFGGRCGSGSRLLFAIAAPGGDPTKVGLIGLRIQEHGALGFAVDDFNAGAGCCGAGTSPEGGRRRRAIETPDHARSAIDDFDGGGCSLGGLSRGAGSRNGILRSRALCR